MTSTRDSQQKLTRFFNYANGTDLEAVWYKQYYGGNMYYLDKDKYVNDNQLLLFSQPIVLLQYDIPAEEEEQQRKTYDVYTKTFQENPNIFGATDKMPPMHLAKFEYCSGYWQYERDPETNTISSKFHAYDNQEKEKFIQEKKQFALQFDNLTYEFKKVNNLKNIVRLNIGASLLLACAGFYAASPIMGLTGCIMTILLANDLKKYSNENKQLQEKINKLENKNALLVSSIFAERKKNQGAPEVKIEKTNRPVYAR